MTGLILPIFLAFAGVAAAFLTYRGIRRGGARYYTLERESLLRQASLTLLISTLLFLGAVGLLAYNQQQLTAPEGEPVLDEDGETNGGANAEAAPDQAPAEEGTPEVNNLPPLPTETPLPGPSPTPTALICRALVEGTFDNGLTLRDSPGGGEIVILAEASILTVLTNEAPAEANGLTWRKVRSLLGDEGWVAVDFITLGEGCE